MKPSSTDRRGSTPGRRATDWSAGGIAAEDATVRPARMDRQLANRAGGLGFADERIEEIIAEAAKQAREKARAEGYAAGWAQGRQAAAEHKLAQATAFERQAEEQLRGHAQRARSLVNALGDAVQAAKLASLPQWEEVADVLAEGALRLAGAALARELRSVDTVVADSVRAALHALTEPTEAVVYLSPQDAALVDLEPVPGVRVVADPSVEPGSVVALTPAQRLRLDLPAALAAAEEVLRS